MGVKTKKYSIKADEERDPMEFDTSFDQRETTVDGYTFHWGINQTRNFADDSVGARHAAFGAQGVVEDTIPTGDSKS